MEKEFVPYEQALALKELGFDEHCFGYYLDKKLNIFHSTSANDRINSKTIEIFSSDVITSPTFSQAFRWFRENYKLHSRVFFGELKELNDKEDEERYDFDIVEQWTIGKDYFDYSYGFKHLYSSGGVYMTHEEAELECLKKLIEICRELK